MQTIIILSALAVIALLTWVLVKSAKKLEVEWRELEEWFDNKYWSDKDD